ncbi:fungal-specific transcription factor domain protein [Xylogone sp. PMI_703]|nr:fungal-specific transcription factor domain protein [Xylogone sp. PMI_703]
MYRMEGGLNAVDLAAHACAPCRKGKRRCDKILPNCSLCERIGRPCDYTDPTPATVDPAELQARIHQLEELVAQLSNHIPSLSTPSDDTAMPAPLKEYSASSNLYSTSLFLDPGSSEYCDAPECGIDVPIPPEVYATMGDSAAVEHIKSQYFKSVNTWMPIINRAKLDRMINSGNRSARPDLALLLLSMKLILEAPTESGVKQSWLYTITKRFCSTLENAGLDSLMKLQASLIIAVYELGHAIFPAAYISIGHCARYGVALGIHNRLAPQMLPKPRSWLDWEERQRVWWLIIILDRYVVAGSDHRPLCTEDPLANTYIPANEEAWEQGEMVPPERVSLSSSVRITVSPFARAAQASNLLGRVIRHCNDQTASPTFMLEDMELLHQATSSLLTLLAEGHGTTEPFYLAQSLCLSALLKLSGYHICDSFDDGEPPPMETAVVFRECMERSIINMKEDCARTAYFAEMFLKTVDTFTISTLSPMVLHCIYRASITLSFISLESGDERYKAGRDICKKALQMMHSRWKAAGAYLELLDLVEKQMSRETF